MKKLLYMAFFALTFACVTSCGGDDPTPDPVPPVDPTPKPDPQPDPPTYPTFDTPQWENEVNGIIGKYEKSMTAYVTLPSEVAYSVNDQLAVFCGNECRGFATRAIISDKAVWYVLVHGTDNDVIRFKYYSATSKYMYVSETIKFEDNMQYGLMDTPKAVALSIVTE